MHHKEAHGCIPSCRHYHWEKEDTRGKTRSCYCFCRRRHSPLPFCNLFSWAELYTFFPPAVHNQKDIFKRVNITILRTATSKTAKKKKISQNDRNMADRRPPLVTLEDKEKCLGTELGKKKVSILLKGRGFIEYTNQYLTSIPLKIHSRLTVIIKSAYFNAHTPYPTLHFTLHAGYPWPPPQLPYDMFSRTITIIDVLHLTNPNLCIINCNIQS